MARIFSITFHYNSTPEHALVSVHQTPHFTEYKISPLNDTVRNLLPCDKVISPSPHEYICPEVPSAVLHGVMKEIIDAISAHTPALSQP